MKINEITKSLYEMSQLIEPVEPSTADPNDNEQQYKSLLRKTKFDRQFDSRPISDNVTLYDSNSEYIGIDNTNKRIIYRMEYSQYTNPVLGNYVVQRWVWSDKNYLNKLPTIGFFDLVDNYSTVVCDEEQTNLGMKFWIKQIHHAFAKNFNVYYIDFTTNELLQLSDVGDIEKFNKAYKIWTTDASSKKRVFVVSDRQLATKRVTEMKLAVPHSEKEVSGTINPKFAQHATYVANGIQAIVFSHNKKPNTIIKMTGVTGTNDPAYQFLRVCVNHQDNPYFPKITNYKSYKNKALTDDDLDYLEQQPSFVMEPIDDKPYQLLIVSEKLYDLNAIGETAIKKLLDDLGLTEVLSRFRKPSIGQAFVTAFNDESTRSLMQHACPDKWFKQALRLLEPLFKNANFLPDMHFNNIMLRQNGHLVIIDPISMIFSGYDT